MYVIFHIKKREKYWNQEDSGDCKAGTIAKIPRQAQPGPQAAPTHLCIIHSQPQVPGQMSITLRQ